MIKIGICDSEKSDGTNIEDFLMEAAWDMGMAVELEIWNSGNELRNYLSEGKHVDLLFLEVELKDQKGTELGKYIRRELGDYNTEICYMSYAKAYAMELFDTQPLDFLIKPLGKGAFYKALEDYLRKKGMQEEQFSFKQRHKHCKINFRDILYFRSVGRQVLIKTLKEEIYFYGKLQDVENKLPVTFIKIHKSYFINYDYVKEYQYTKIKMENDEVINISIPYRNQVQERLSHLLSEY